MQKSKAQPSFWGFRGLGCGDLGVHGTAFFREAAMVPKRSVFQNVLDNQVFHGGPMLVAVGSNLTSYAHGQKPA